MDTTPTELPPSIDELVTEHQEELQDAYDAGGSTIDLSDPLYGGHVQLTRYEEVALLGLEGDDRATFLTGLLKARAAKNLIKKQFAAGVVQNRRDRKAGRRRVRNAKRRNR